MKAGFSTGQLDGRKRIIFSSWKARRAERKRAEMDGWMDGRREELLHRGWSGTGLG